MNERKFSKKIPKESTSFRMEPTEKRKLEKEAEEYGLTLSDYTARLLIDIRIESEQNKENVKITNEKNASLQEENEFYKSMSEKYKQEAERLKNEMEDLKANSINLAELHPITKKELVQLKEKYLNQTSKQIMEACIHKSIEIDKNKYIEVFLLKDTLDGYFLD